MKTSSSGASSTDRSSSRYSRSRSSRSLTSPVNVKTYSVPSLAPALASAVSPWTPSSSIPRRAPVDAVELERPSGDRLRGVYANDLPASIEQRFDRLDCDEPTVADDPDAVTQLSDL